MTTVVLVIHLLLAIALIGVVLLQRSEGGVFGMGGGGMGQNKSQVQLVKVKIEQRNNQIVK